MRLFVESVCSLLDFDLESVILLEENHGKDDFLSKTGYKIRLVRDLEQGVIESDGVLIIYSENLPIVSVCEIKSLCELYNKTCLKIDCSKDEKEYSEYLSNARFEYTDKAVTILLISIGSSTNHILSELTISHCFRQKNINVQQVYSHMAKSLIESLSENRILKSGILDTRCSHHCNNNIWVITVCIDSLEDFKKNIDFWRPFAPDFVIVNLSLGHLTRDIVEKTISNVISSSVDIIVRSRYRNINNEYAVYCDDYAILENDALDIHSTNYAEELVSSIFAKLVLPQGVHRL